MIVKEYIPPVKRWSIKQTVRQQKTVKLSVWQQDLPVGGFP